LDLLGFIWWNRDFSKGYKRKNKKIFFALNSRLRLCSKSGLPSLFPGSPVAAGPFANPRFPSEESIQSILGLSQEFVDRNLDPAAKY
jgi:hypothetical protein